MVLIFSGLPAILLLLDLPSLTIGDNALWILRWKNDADGSGITFNLIPLLVTALLIGLFGFLIQQLRNRR